MIVGLAGQKQVGKSTVSARLSEIGFQTLSFAATLKSMGRLLLRNTGMSDQEIQWAELNKELAIPEVGVSWRVLCQTLGTEWGRTHINSAIWLMTAQHEMMRRSLALDYVIDDVRFENEAQFIRDRGGLIIHITRSGGSRDVHASESGIAIQDVDVWLDNEHDIEFLHERVLNAINKHWERRHE